MQYYTLDYSTDPKEIGDVYPQMGSFPKDYDEVGIRSVRHLTNDSFPSTIPDIRFEQKPEAIITDFLSPSKIRSYGLLVSGRVHEVFKNFKLMMHKVYPATIYSDLGVLNFYYYHFVSTDLKGMDLKRSKFMVTRGLTAAWKIQDITIESYSDIREKMKSVPRGGIIGVEKIYLDEEFRKEPLDLFFFPLLHQHFFVSEALVQKLKESKVNGYSVLEQSIINTD